MTEIDHDYTSEIVCPYCGYEFDCSYEYSSDDTIDCHECEKIFSMIKYFNVNYSTKKIQCANGDGPHKWRTKSFEFEGNMVLKNLYRCKLCDVSRLFEDEERYEFESTDKKTK